MNDILRSIYIYICIFDHEETIPKWSERWELWLKQSNLVLFLDGRKDDRKWFLLLKLFEVQLAGGVAMTSMQMSLHASVFK